MTNQQVIAHFDCCGRTDSMKTTDDFVELLRHLLSPHQHVFVVRGERSFEECGAAVFLREVQQGTAIVYHPFYSFEKNPKKEDAIVGAHELIAAHSEAIVAIGGGSAIDVAKLIRNYANRPNMPLIAIPTTAGTGAESTQFAVCYVNGVKTSMDDPRNLPDYALLMPEFTMSNSQFLTATCGFDAFAQAVEAYWNVFATEESDLYAEEALVLLVRALYSFVENPQECMKNILWRDQMMIGANLSGQAINITRTTAPHAMSYILTSKYGYAHGHAVALTFPYFAKLNMECPKELYMGRNYRHYVEKMKWLRKCFGLKETTDVEEFLRRFINQMGLGLKTGQTIDLDVVAKSVNMDRAKNNPHLLTEDILAHAAESILKM